MSNPQRPGGLTALAVFNFIFSFTSLLSALGLIAIVVLLGVGAGGEPESLLSDQQQAQLAAFTNIGSGVLYFIVVTSVVSAILLLLSGVGYLKMKKFLGRDMGNLYAMTALISAVLTVFIMPRELGGGINLSAILSVLYPAITAICINVIFKDDFTP